MQKVSYGPITLTCTENIQRKKKKKKNKREIVVQIQMRV